MFIVKCFRIHQLSWRIPGNAYRIMIIDGLLFHAIMVFVNISSNLDKVLTLMPPFFSCRLDLLATGVLNQNIACRDTT